MTTTTKVEQPAGTYKATPVADLDPHHHNKSEYRCVYRTLTFHNYTLLELLKGHASSTGTQECWGGRHTLSLLGFLGFSLSFAQKASFSVAIVAMVKSNSSADTNGSDVCPLPDHYNPDNSGNLVNS